MRLKYDLNVGALYIGLSDHAVDRTQQVDDNTSIDLDASGAVVGIEVISIARPWPINDILARYDIPAAEEAQIRAYFPASRIAHRLQQMPKIGIATPAPAQTRVAA